MGYFQNHDGCAQYKPETLVERNDDRIEQPGQGT